MAMLPLTSASASEILNSDIKVHVKTIGSADASCAIKIPNEIKAYAKTLSVQRLEEHCKIGIRAREEATIHTKAQLNQVDKAHK